jgi:predicted KAP-like P-loop ATPase
VEELLDAIETGYAEARPPTANSIALLGEWGSGKSSVLNCLAERLTERGHSDAKWAELLLVRIDAWELHSPDALLRAFVGAITGSLCDRWFLPTLSAKARSYVRAVSAAGEARIGALVDWLLTPPSGESEPSYILQSLLAPATRQVFDGHSADYRGGVLLVIDELDRLEPEQLHALLRLIGAVKRVPWITTVIAAEYRRIQAALTTAEGPAAPLDRLDAEAAKYFSRVVIMPRCTDA